MNLKGGKKKRKLQLLLFYLYCASSDWTTCTWYTATALVFHWPYRCEHTEKERSYLLSSFAIRCCKV